MSQRVFCSLKKSHFSNIRRNNQLITYLINFFCSQEVKGDDSDQFFGRNFEGGEKEDGYRDKRPKVFVLTFLDIDVVVTM